MEGRKEDKCLEEVLDRKEKSFFLLFLKEKNSGGLDRQK